jgi:SPP1 family predicted phage head-tail adaptor
MRTGRLRDSVQFEKPEREKNPITGSIVEGFALVAKRSASITPISGGEQTANSAEITQATALITVRYDRALSGLSNEWRIVDNRNNRIYDIEHTDPITSATKWLKIRCIHRSK